MDYFKDIPVNEWEDLEGKSLIIRVNEESGIKILCGYDPIDGKMYVLSESTQKIK